MVCIFAPILGFIFIETYSLVSSATPFLKALLWGLLIFEALLGYGLLFGKVMFGNAEFSCLTPAYGTSLILMMSGWLNILSLLKPPIITALIISGVISFYFFVANKFYKSISIDCNVITVLPSPLFFLGATSVLAVLWAYICATSSQAFNFHDDYHAYLFFPEKILQLGSLGIDPYSERRLISGLAGNSVLAAIGLTQMKWYFLHSIDWGLGLLTFAYSIYIYKSSEMLQRILLVKLGLLVGISLMAIPAVNITSNFLPMMLIFSIWILFLEFTKLDFYRADLLLKYSISIGLMLATLLSLKSTLTPYVAISFLFFCSYLRFELKASWSILLKFCVLISITVFFALLPWMIDLFLSSGTFFYPILGKGFHAIRYGYFLSATSNFLLAGNFFSDLWAVFSLLGKSIFSITLMSMIYLIYQRYKSGDSTHICMLAIMPLLASILNCIVVGFALGGYGAYRYVHFVGLASLVTSIMIAVPLFKKKFFFVLVLSVCTFFIVRGFQDQRISYPKNIEYISNSLVAKQPINAAELVRYDAVSRALPLTGAILLRVAYPFMLKISSDTFVADYPGAASPPPGMPIGQGPEALRNYLLSMGIQYIVWDYQTQANFSKDAYGDRMAQLSHPWIGSEARLSFDFQENLEKLRLERPNFFDKNGIAIIDLR